MEIVLTTKINSFNRIIFHTYITSARKKNCKTYKDVRLLFYELMTAKKNTYIDF